MCRQKWRGAVALAAAYLLVLQAALTGLALGTQAGPVRQDALAAAICSSVGAAAEDSPAPPAGHQDPVSCCLPGCGMSGQSLAPPPTGAGLALRVPTDVAAARPVACALCGPRYERTPRNTRAPPRAA